MRFDVIIGSRDDDILFDISFVFFLHCFDNIVKNAGVDFLSFIISCVIRRVNFFKHAFRQQNKTEETFQSVNMAHQKS